MAQRKSRSTRGKGRKQPELRTGGGRTAKSERSRHRQAAVAQSAPTGPAVRMRPAGPAGYAFILLFAWAGVAAVVLGALYLDRWNTVDYPDSLWLFAAIGVVAVAPAVGRVARRGADGDAWGVQALLVPVGLFVAEVIAGPDCPNGATCDAIGARGWLGLYGSIALLIVAAVVAWLLARWMYRSAASRRPAQGRVRYGIVAGAMVGLLVLPGSVLAAALVGADLLMRDTPGLVNDAAQQVEEECYGLSDAPDLTVRAAPQGYNPDWTTFAVRRSSESRPAVGADRLPSDWVGLDDVHPYEATVSYNSSGEVVTLACRRVGPNSGNATAADLEQAEPESNALDSKQTGREFLPRFFSEGQAGPSEAGMAKAKADAAAEAARAKAAAAEVNDVAPSEATPGATTAPPDNTK